MQPNFPEELKHASAIELKEFEKSYKWLHDHMPQSFFEALDESCRILIARNLLSFSLQDAFIPIHFKHKTIILCKDEVDADLKILKHFKDTCIQYYRTFVSNNLIDAKSKLKVSIVYFKDLSYNQKISEEKKQELIEQIQKKNPKRTLNEIQEILPLLSPNFLQSMNMDRLLLAIECFFEAKSSINCQYVYRFHEKAPSMELVLAWKNAPKVGFLYRLATIIQRHNLDLQKVIANYVEIDQNQTVLILSLGLHTIEGQNIEDKKNIEDFLKELVLLKTYKEDDLIEQTFVNTKQLTGNQAHILRNMTSFVHQMLVYLDPNLYLYENVEEGLCRHPELSVELCKIFEKKFNPSSNCSYKDEQEQFLRTVNQIDTGQPILDQRRKNVLKQALSFITYTLKTNFYLQNKTAFSFRIDPKYFEQLPYDRQDKFPEIPYGIFFIRGANFIGFNIRFKDLARGGVRTVIPEKLEQYITERNTIFSEAYNLAFTQQKKNKDIPEGGAKTAILLEPFEVFQKEIDLYKKEQEEKNSSTELFTQYLKNKRLYFIYDSQTAFIESFMTLLLCDEKGVLKEKMVKDFWKKPEYIYLGPDENMFNEMIVKIADYAQNLGYKPGRSFMSSKPGAGINHKEFGVTSFGVNVYMHQVLLFLNINPEKDPFTVKISGGPDGDVAGNQILNLYKYYPNTAKLVALTDGSGTIFDPQGLDLEEMAKLFKKASPIREYPASKLSNGGFLLDIRTKKQKDAYTQLTLLYRKKNDTVLEDWIQGNEMNQLYRTNVHQVKADIFIPAGGRPRTLNETNYTSYLDENGHATSKAIVEGANLYLTAGARRALEKLGTLIIKDSSCNKGGVICSSFEVLASLCMTQEEFLKHKKQYVDQVLEHIAKAALNEANVLLSTHKEKGLFLTDISEKISEKINLFKYQILEYLETIELDDTLIPILLAYCPKLLREHFKKAILTMPDIHKKAVIAAYIAAHLVYEKGIDWNPSIVDLLPMIAENPSIIKE